MDFNDLKKGMTEAANEAFMDFLKESGEDFDAMKNAIEDSLEEILYDMFDGKMSLDKIIAKHDTATKMLTAAALFKLSEQQTKAVQAAQKLVEQILWIVLRKIIISIS